MSDVLHQLGTCHHSAVFLDTKDGFVRHGHGPANLFLACAADGRHASLVHRLDDGSLRGIRIPPGGAQPAELHELSAAAAPQEWLVVASEGGRAALFSGDLYLCAEGDGTVTLSRSSHEAWERFWFEPARAPGMLSDRVAKQQRIDQADILSVLRMVRPHSASRPKIRLGSLGDGGYVVPDDLAGLDGVISLGIGDEVSFDLDLAERGCTIFQYDPTVDGPPKPHSNFHFERIGWARHDSGDARSLATMLDENHLQGSTDLMLKFDVEDAEWDALQSVAIDDLAKFRVVVGEFHGLETLTEPDRFQLICQAFERLTANHVVTHVHPNNNGGIELVEGIVVPRILEITFLRRDRAKFIADHQPIPTPLDYANVAWKREIVMTPFD
jgi:hypothetical protein